MRRPAQIQSPLLVSSLLRLAFPGRQTIDQELHLSTVIKSEESQQEG